MNYTISYLRLLLSFLFISLSLTVFPRAYAFPLARNASEAYDSLSRLSSTLLLEQGREAFEKRDGAEALSRFLIVAERYDDDAPLDERKASIRALNNAGCVYKYFYYDYPQAYDYLTRALELCEVIDFKELKPVVMVNMGDLFNDYALIYDSENFSHRALSLFDDCFQFAVANKDWELMTTSFYNLSNGVYDLDLSRYSELFSDDIPADTPDLEFTRLQFRGIERMQKGDYAGARNFFRRQPGAVNTKWEATRDTISSLVNIAVTYEKEGKTAEAIRVLNEALAYSERSDLPDISSDIASRLSETFLAAGDSASFLHYRNLYLEKKDELHNSHLVDIGEMKFISDLKKEEKKAQAADMKHRTYRFITISLLIVVLTIAVSAFLILRQNRTLKSRNQSLFDKYSLLLAAESANRKVISDPPVEGEGDSGKYQHSKLDQDRRQALLDKIQGILADADVISSPDFSLKQLADLASSNTTYVSQVINESFGVSFSTLLGNCRVRLVCQRISSSDVYDNFTIEAIANSVGFKSRTAFLNAFKREVGLSPSQFIRIAYEKKKEEAKE